MIKQLESKTLLLLHPGFGISTGWSYQTLAKFPEALNGQSGRARDLVAALNGDTTSWGDLLYNSLERPAFWKYPVLELHVEHLKENGCEAALMSGSGSTIFGVAASNAEAESALESFHARFGSQGWSGIVEL